MNRQELLAHLFWYGCVLTKEGNRHTLFYNPQTFKNAAMPRHIELHERLADEICKQLEVPLFRSA